MDRRLEELYFEWLCAGIALHDRVPQRTYFELFRVLHNTEFVWMVNGDHNRADDGIELRGQFLAASGLEPDPSWDSAMCSIFEMLIAFSIRAEFSTDIPANVWFWEFLSNLRLLEWDDDKPDHEYVSEQLYIFNMRLYEPNGDGGLFPLNRPPEDQRKVELWYQFFAYLDDNPDRFMI